MLKWGGLYKSRKAAIEAALIIAKEEAHPEASAPRVKPPDWQWMMTFFHHVTYIDSECWRCMIEVVPV